MMIKHTPILYRYSWAYQNQLEACLVFFVLAIIFVLVYLYYSYNWRPFKKFSNKGACTKCGKPLHFGSDRCKWCGNKELFKEPVKQKRSTKKNACGDCGTVMEYRGDMESWYCPACRTYR